MKYNISQTQKNNIKKSISSYLDTRKDICTAYLFGSFNLEGSFSDIDLGVLAYEKVSNFVIFEMDLEIAIEKIVRHNVDIRLLNSAPIPFCQNVIRTGKVIYDENPNLRSEFESNVLK